MDYFLDALTKVTKEDDQRAELRQVVRRYPLHTNFNSVLACCVYFLCVHLLRCTPDDLKYFVRLLKHDLRINSGPKHVYVSFVCKMQCMYMLNSILTTL